MNDNYWINNFFDKVSLGKLQLGEKDDLNIVITYSKLKDIIVLKYDEVVDLRHWCDEFIKMHNVHERFEQGAIRR